MRDRQHKRESKEMMTTSRKEDADDHEATLSSQRHLLDCKKNNIHTDSDSISNGSKCVVRIFLKRMLFIEI